MRVLVLAIVAPCLVAQSQAPLANDQGLPIIDVSDPRTGSVEGVVRDFQNRLPVAGAVVRLSGPSSPPAAQTDDEGRYSFRSLASGTYGVVVDRMNNFVASGRRVTLAYGRHLSNFDIMLHKEGVIAGRVMDRHGNPVPEATVGVLAYGYQNGRELLTSFHYGRTNDLGEFRVRSLRPGRYHVHAEPPLLKVQIQRFSERSHDAVSLSANAPTYYPNAPNREGSGRIRLMSGQILEGIDVTLRREKAACVRAVVNSASSRRISVSLSANPAQNHSRVASGIVTSGKEFEVCGVPTGSYRFSASGYDDTQERSYASRVVEVTDRDIDIGPVYLKAPGNVGGELLLAKTKPEGEAPPGVTVGLEAKGRSGMMGEWTRSFVERPGRFTIAGVVEGEYWLRISGLTGGYYVKEATAGGRDVWREPMRVGMGDLRIVLAADGSVVAGQAVGNDGRPVGKAVIALALSPVRQPLATNEFRTAVTGPNGSFEFTGVAPGSYKLVALVNVPETSVGPETFQYYPNQTVSVAVAPREKKRVTLTPIVVDSE